MSPRRVGGLGTPGTSYDVVVSNGYAYIADGDSGFQIIDVSDPVNPIRTGGFDTPGHVEGIAISGNYLYVADGFQGIEVFDITSKNSPKRVGWNGGECNVVSVNSIGDPSLAGARCACFVAVHAA